MDDPSVDWRRRRATPTVRQVAAPQIGTHKRGMCRGARIGHASSVGHRQWRDVEIAVMIRHRASIPGVEDSGNADLALVINLTALIENWLDQVAEQYCSPRERILMFCGMCC